MKPITLKDVHLVSTETVGIGMNQVQIAENMRFYGEMRFKQLSVWLAGMSLLIAGSVQYADRELAPEFLVREALAIAAVFLTSVIWIMEVRSTLYWVENRERAPDLWPQKRVIMGKLLNSTNAVALLYIGNSIAWIWLAYKWQMAGVWILVLAAITAILVVFTVINYWPLWSAKVTP